MNDAPRKTIDEAGLVEFIRERGSDCLLLARHGETQWNTEGRLQGQKDVPLNGRGHKQALALARLLGNVPIAQVHSSTLLRCQQTARSIVEVNLSGPTLTSSDLLKETGLGLLEGELKSGQSTPELTRHYQRLCRDEIGYRVPAGECLRDVAARVQRFFSSACQVLQGINLIVGHRNVNKMVVKHMLGLSFDQGYRVEHENQRLYLYFGASKELWSIWIAGKVGYLTRGYATTTDSPYA